MKKIYLAICFIVFTASVFAQEQPKPETKNESKNNFASRANDHLVIQIGYAGWSGRPDTINASGLPRSFNAYFMFDFPFKTNPHLSMAIGAGVGTDHIYFSQTYIGIKDITSKLVFQDLRDTSHFKKYKLATAYLEAPIEFRYSSNPETPNKSYKASIGVKVGTLLNAHTKGRTFESSTGSVINPYTEKQSSKHWFNTTRFEATARFSYGVFGIFGAYQLNTLFKQGFAPDIHAYTIGLSINGL
jgi:hypothetical protein